MFFLLNRSAMFTIIDPHCATVNLGSANDYTLYKVGEFRPELEDHYVQSDK